MQTKPDFIVSLSDASAGLSQVGGKGASLARMAAAGLPAPPGFHITTAAYRQFVAEHELQAQILAAASIAIPDQPATLEEASGRIGKLFAQSAMPEDIAEAIRRAYAGLGEGDVPVAVRSSATAEDLPDMSFAGQQETYLNMRGEAMVLDAVRRCWASLWTARAIGYRARHNIAPQDVSLAVVVQVLVPADADGILFTANPLTGARSQVMINAAWGLGEAIVGGHVTPDTVIVDKASGRIVERKINKKDVITIRTTEGTRQDAVPKNRRNKAVLSPAQSVELARIGMQIEELYSQPMDIEWAIYDGCISILQARPITALPDPPRRFSFQARETIHIPAREHRKEYASRQNRLSFSALVRCAENGSRNCSPRLRSVRPSAKMPSRTSACLTRSSGVCCANWGCAWQRAVQSPSRKTSTGLKLKRWMR